MDVVGLICRGVAGWQHLATTPLSLLRIVRDLLCLPCVCRCHLCRRFCKVWAVPCMGPQHARHGSLRATRLYGRVELYIIVKRVVIEIHLLPAIWLIQVRNSIMRCHILL